MKKSKRVRKPKVTHVYVVTLVTQGNAWVDRMTVAEAEIFKTVSKRPTPHSHFIFESRDEAYAQAIEHLQGQFDWFKSALKRIKDEYLRGDEKIL